MKNQKGVIAVVAVVTLVFVLLGLLFFGVPVWRVWQQGLAGEASLRRADQERQILVSQARAEVEAASLRAEAIAIVGDATHQFPEYRLQEFLGAFGDAMSNGSIEKIIYVPTEANIPVMEAGRR